MTNQIRRREFISVLGGAAASSPLAASAQQPAMPVIGFIHEQSLEQRAHLVAAFRRRLNDAGHVEGMNVAIEYHWANNQLDRLQAMASELVRRKVTVIVATSTAAVLASKAATTTIPIVFYTGGDPVQLGLVASLNRPGGNLTGVTSLTVEIGPKRLELLHEMVPTATTIALLVNPTNLTLTEEVTRDVQAAARTLGLQLHVLNASSERDFDTAFAAMVQLRAGGLMIGPEPLFTNRREQLVELTLRHAIPTVFELREHVVAGGLMSYGSSLTDAYQLVGGYTGRILRGDKPADLPVQQATRVELIINMKTAKALGLTFPLTLLGRADEVIE
jgi:putative ABC transport system substrate-binding protein